MKTAITFLCCLLLAFPAPAFDTLNVGSSPNDHTGDTVRQAMIKINGNFAGAMSQTNVVGYFDPNLGGGKAIEVGTIGTDLYTTGGTLFSHIGFDEVRHAGAAGEVFAAFNPSVDFLNVATVISNSLTISDGAGVLAILDGGGATVLASGVGMPTTLNYGGQQFVVGNGTDTQIKFQDGATGLQLDANTTQLYFDNTVKLLYGGAEGTSLWDIHGNPRFRADADTSGGFQSTRISDGAGNDRLILSYVTPDLVYSSVIKDGLQNERFNAMSIDGASGYNVYSTVVSDGRGNQRFRANRIEQDPFGTENYSTEIYDGINSGQARLRIDADVANLEYNMVFFDGHSHPRLTIEDNEGAGSYGMYAKDPGGITRWEYDSLGTYMAAPDFDSKLGVRNGQIVAGTNLTVAGNMEINGDPDHPNAYGGLASDLLFIGSGNAGSGDVNTNLLVVGSGNALSSMENCIIIGHALAFANKTNYLSVEGKGDFGSLGVTGDANLNGVSAQSLGVNGNITVSSGTITGTHIAVVYAGRTNVTAGVTSVLDIPIGHTMPGSTYTVHWTIVGAPDSSFLAGGTVWPVAYIASTSTTSFELYNSQGNWGGSQVAWSVEYNP